MISHPNRRGSCPSLTAAMPTGDGLLARLSPVGTMPLDDFAALCATARRHGNGIIEVTGRGNLQIRGLTAQSAAAFAAAVAALDIATNEGVPLVVDPLAGLDPTSVIDATAVAATIRSALDASGVAPRLSPKVSVLIDGGSRLHLDAVVADVRLRVEVIPGGVRAHVGVGGDAVTGCSIGAVWLEQAAPAVVSLLDVVAARGRDARAHQLVRAEGMAPFRAAIEDLVMVAPALPARAPIEPIDTHHLSDGSAILGIGLAFGHSEAVALEALIEAAQAAGAQGLRSAPGRVLLVLDIEKTRELTFRRTAEELGFIIRPNDPRRSIAACPGAPLCTAAKIPTRALAPAVAEAAATLLDGSVTIHLSGCPKGCAHPAPAALSIVGHEAGCGWVIDGVAGDAPRRIMATSALPLILRQVARRVAQARQSGQNAASALSCLDLDNLAFVPAGETSDG